MNILTTDSGTKGELFVYFPGEARVDIHRHYLGFNTVVAAYPGVIVVGFHAKGYGDAEAKNQAVV